MPKDDKSREFTKRPKVTRTITGIHKVWNRKDGECRVVESISSYGLSTVWYVMRLYRRDVGQGKERISGWGIASRHRKKSAAFKAGKRF